jgi:O-antigen/teichoic acid export membrane protein
LNPLRQLISQTAIYGLSSILGRFLNYLLVPLYTYTFSTGEYGVVSEFYAYAGFFAVVLTSGLETGYFRFRKQEGLDAHEVYTNALCFLVSINVLFVAMMAYIKTPLAEWLHYPQHPEYLIWFSLILALDAITALPFARLRAENRAWRFAGIKMTEILLAIGLNLFFLLACPKIQTLWPDSLIATWYDPAIGVGYIFLANLLASGFKLALLYPQFKRMRC